MPVTQQDLLAWTEEYKAQRQLNPHIVDFNEWIKERIVWKEQQNDLQQQQQQTSSPPQYSTPQPPQYIHEHPTQAPSVRRSPTYPKPPQKKHYHSSIPTKPPLAQFLGPLPTTSSPAIITHAYPARRSPTQPKPPQKNHYSPTVIPTTSASTSPAIITRAYKPRYSPHHQSPQYHLHHPSVHHPPVLHPVIEEQRIIPQAQPRHSPHHQSSQPHLHPPSAQHHPPVLHSVIEEQNRSSPTHQATSTDTSPQHHSSSSTSDISSPASPSSPSNINPVMTKANHITQVKEKKAKHKHNKFKPNHSPPGAALVRSLSQSYISPLPSNLTPQQLANLAAQNATYGFQFEALAQPGDVTELKGYINEFQAKQQSQLVQIFDMVERINDRISRNPASTSSPSSPASPSRPQIVKKSSPKSSKAVSKVGRPVLHPVKHKSLIKANTPFAAVFSDQITSIRKILQDEYNRTADDATSYTKKLYQMSKLRKIHQVSVEFLLSLAQKMQFYSQFSKSDTSDLGLDLGMIISQLAGLNAEMQLKFPFVFANEPRPPASVSIKRKDPFVAKLAKQTQTAKTTKTAFKTETESQTNTSKSETGSQTKTKDSNKRVQTDSSLDSSALSADMLEVNDNIQKISSDTELLKSEFGELKTVTQSSAQSVLKKFESLQQHSHSVDKEANKELKELKLTFVQFLDKFEQMNKERYASNELDKEIERENRERRERLGQEETERKARLEAERRELEERYIRDKEETDRKERRERDERERQDRESRERRERDYMERRERQEKEDRERRDREERYRREREETETMERLERERIDQERRAKEDREWKRRIDQERQAREEKERRLIEERELREQEEMALEREMRASREREEHERQERDRILREQRENERLQREQEERERRELERQLMYERALESKQQRERADRERLERERHRRENEELARYKFENSKNLELLMSTLHSMEGEEYSLRNSTQSLLLTQSPTATKQPRIVPHSRMLVTTKPKKGITDRLLEDLCMLNAREVDGMCGDYLDDLVQLQLDDVLHNPNFDVSDLL